MIPAALFLRGTGEQRIGNALTMIVFGIGTVLIAARAYREWRELRCWDLAVLLAGGAIGTLTDAQARAMVGLRTAPVTNYPVFYKAFGITIAPYMATAFPLYVAGCGYLATHAFRGRWPRRRYWAWIAALCVLDIGFELIAINVFKLYAYTGNQPYKIFGLPLAWPAAYITIGILAGGLVHLLNQHVHGSQRAILILIPAAGYVAFMALAAWPLITAVHTRIPQPAVDATAIIAIGIMAALCHLLSTFLPAAPAADSTNPQSGRGSSKETACSDPQGR